jgi:hypothetical protein
MSQQLGGPIIACLPDALAPDATPMGVAFGLHTQLLGTERKEEHRRPS